MDSLDLIQITILYKKRNLTINMAIILLI